MLPPWEPLQEMLRPEEGYSRVRVRGLRPGGAPVTRVGEGECRKGLTPMGSAHDLSRVPISRGKMLTLSYHIIHLLSKSET